MSSLNVNKYYENYWNRDTDVSDSDVTTSERKRRLLVALSRHVTAGEYVFDLGCGGRKFTSWILQAGYAAQGMDISSNALEMAKRNNTDVSFELLAPDGSIPAPEAHYAAVWCSEVIEHILDVHAFLSEIRRVLKPGGILILTTPYHGLLKNLLIVLLKFDRHFNPEYSHIRYFDKKGLSRCLNKAGFNPFNWGGLGCFYLLWRTWFVVARKV